MTLHVEVMIRMTGQQDKNTLEHHRTAGLTGPRLSTLDSLNMTELTLAPGSVILNFLFQAIEPKSNIYNLYAISYAGKDW